LIRQSSLKAFACIAFLAQSAFGSTVYTFVRLNPSGSVSLFNGGGINSNNVVAGLVNGKLFTFDGTAYSYYNVNANQMGGIDDAGNIAYTTSSSQGGIYSTATNSITIFTEPNAPQFTFVTGISGDGKVAGYYLDSSFSQFGFVKDGNSYTTVSYPDPHGQIYGFGVNNSGDVLGLSSCCRAGVRFLLKNGVYTTILDSLGNASNGVSYGLNDLDQVVGWYDNGSGGPIHGFTWDGGLTNTVDYPGATSTMLHDINNNGVIFGAARDANGDFLFIATPHLETPEPGSCWLITTGLIAVVAGRRRLSRI
jgi:hypothetical protein